ncbi:MAG: Uma2 family endonuclease [Planctomycetes bacterium]|nr:Uma2 family endonuclease [Planctomycetota bacterium]
MSTMTRITIADYDRMIAKGDFEGESVRPRLELIEGEILTMSPIGPSHENLVDLLTEWSLTNLPRDLVRVRIQNSIGIPSLDSAPQPDIAWVKRDDYSSGRPQPAAVLGIIEVADSSLDYDRGTKARLFATGGIVDYWVVNIPDRCVEVFRQPRDGEYRSHECFKPGDEIQPLAFPAVNFPVAPLFLAK